MFNRSFQSSLRNVVLLPLILFGILAGSLVFQLGKMNAASVWVLHTDEVIDEARILQTLLLDMETGMRGFLSEGDSQFLHPYAVAKPELEPILKSLEQLTSTKPEQVARVHTLNLSVKKWINYADQKVSAGRKSIGLNQKVHDLDSAGKSMMDDLMRVPVFSVHLEPQPHSASSLFFSSSSYSFGVLNPIEV